MRGQKRKPVDKLFFYVFQRAEIIASRFRDHAEDTDIAEFFEVSLQRAAGGDSRHRDFYFSDVVRFSDARVDGDDKVVFMLSLDKSAVLVEINRGHLLCGNSVDVGVHSDDVAEQISDAGA